MTAMTPLEDNHDYLNIPTDVPLGEITAAIERCAKSAPGETIVVTFLTDKSSGMTMYEIHAVSVKRRKRTINLRGVLLRVLGNFGKDLRTGYDYVAGRLSWRVGGGGVEFSPLTHPNPNAKLLDDPVDFIAGQIAEILGPEYLPRAPKKH